MTVTAGDAAVSLWRRSWRHTDPGRADLHQEQSQRPCRAAGTLSEVPGSGPHIQGLCDLRQVCVYSTYFYSVVNIVRTIFYLWWYYYNVEQFKSRRLTCARHVAIWCWNMSSRRTLGNTAHSATAHSSDPSQGPSLPDYCNPSFVQLLYCSSSIVEAAGFYSL